MKGKWGVTADGYRWSNKRSYKWMHSSEYPGTHGIKYFKRMNVIVYDLYLNKAVTKKLKEENLGLGISKYILMIILIRTVRCP